MAEVRRVLLLDDGELDRVEAILRELEVECLRLVGRAIGRSVEAPGELLVTSGRRALNEMPKLVPVGEDAAPPTWVCLHNQDFLPLRQRLRDMGVHFLVQAALDQESLRLFLQQLLYRGAERRGYRRLPLGGEVMYRGESADQRVKLLELSQDVCRIRTSERLPIDQELCVVLPPALGGGEELELPSRVTHRTELQGPGGATSYSVVLKFDPLDSEAATRLEKLATGNQIGSRLTPLAEPPRRGTRPAAVPVSGAAPPARAEESDAAPASEEPAPVSEEPLETAPPRVERRGEERVMYPQRVQAFTGDGAPRAALGRDLSTEGIFIDGPTQLSEGDRVTLALYPSDPRGEPLLIDARVVRDDGERGVGLSFESITPDQRFRLEKLAAQLPPLRSLDDDSVRIVSELTRRSS